MEIDDKLVKEISAIGVILLFGILVFFAIKPLLFAVIWGLIFGYVFMPVYNWLLRYLRNEYVAASVTLLLAMIIILIPLWFVIPLMVQQIFGVYTSMQTLDMGAFISSVFPASSAQFVVQATATINVIVGKLTSSLMNSLLDLSLNLPYLLVDLVIVAFVFFFTLKDAEKLKEFVRGISPLSKLKEKMVIKQFKDITYSTIYGRFVVGIVQGLLSGLGFLIFGVHNALLFTMLAVFLAVLPSLGVYLIWIPIAVYMFATGSIALAIAFVLYNLILVSNIDNLLLAYIISKRTTLSPVIALVSSIGGLFLFGLIGIILGPLIFAYFIILLDLYRNKNLLDLFSKEEPVEPIKSESK